MATVKELKATARPKAGKGAARAERREGRVPAVIYGDNQAPVTISIDDKSARQAIFAGHFLTTIFNIDLDGKKHRVIPRDFSLDPVKDFPLHIDSSVSASAPRSASAFRCMSPALKFRRA